MEIQEVIEIAINALEKQIPQKPIDDRYPWAICPTCGGSVYLKNVQEQIHNEETFYCECCGQALNWSINPTEKGGVADTNVGNIHEKGGVQE